MDETDLKPGDDAWPTMKAALQGARVVIPILSQGYANSRWCMEELALMIRQPASVMPVFYDVGPSLDGLLCKLSRYPGTSLAHYLQAKSASAAKPF